MAKLKGPLLSLSAHGKIANDLIYSNRRQTNIARAFHYPKPDPSRLQWIRRHIIGFLTAHWQSMSAADQTNWNSLADASGKKISGFNYFIQQACSDLYTHHGLCGYWPCTEPTGTTAYDYSGAGLNGVLGNYNPARVPSRASGQNTPYGSALDYDGVDDLVRVGTGSRIQIYGKTEFSILVWVLPHSAGQNNLGQMLSKQQGSTAGYMLRWDYLSGTKTRLTFTLVFSGSDVFTRSGYTVELNKWSLLAATFNEDADNKGKLYINGVEPSTYLQIAGSGNISDDSSKLLNFGKGAYSPLNAFDGLMHHVRIYNRALSADEIAKNYDILRTGKKRQPKIVH